jgi:enamine deaminase RidA (YjgF/YER057c/UK114 family)
VVKNPSGWIFLGGGEGIDPNTKGNAYPGETCPVDVLPGVEAQARLCFKKIKSSLEEIGLSLRQYCENIVLRGRRFSQRTSIF